MEYLLTQKDDCTVITIRGTEAGKPFKGRGWRDIARDLLFIPCPARSGGVGHFGFVSAGQGLADAIKLTLSPGATIEISGHSLGAGAAVFLALELLDTYRIRQMVLFGCPQTHYAFKPLDKIRRINCTSYANNKDPVALKPSFARHAFPLTVLPGDYGWKYWPYSIQAHWVESYKHGVTVDSFVNAVQQITRDF